jgi:hypothetical protein
MYMPRAIFLEALDIPIPLHIGLSKLAEDVLYFLSL